MIVLIISLLLIASVAYGASLCDSGERSASEESISEKPAPRNRTAELIEQNQRTLINHVVSRLRDYAGPWWYEDWEGIDGLYIVLTDGVIGISLTKHGEVVITSPAIIHQLKGEAAEEISAARLQFELSFGPDNLPEQRPRKKYGKQANEGADVGADDAAEPGSAE